MKKWLLECSKEAIEIDFETIIESEEEPFWWECQNIAKLYDCDYWIVTEYKED